MCVYILGIYYVLLYGIAYTYTYREMAHVIYNRDSGALIPLNRADRVHEGIGLLGDRR